MLIDYALENLSKGLEVMERTKPGMPLKTFASSTHDRRYICVSKDIEICEHLA
jgi:hypothetical protein